MWSQAWTMWSMLISCYPGKSSESWVIRFSQQRFCWLKAPVCNLVINNNMWRVSNSSDFGLFCLSFTLADLSSWPLSALHSVLWAPLRLMCLIKLSLYIYFTWQKTSTVYTRLIYFILAMCLLDTIQDPIKQRVVHLEQDHTALCAE